MNQDELEQGLRALIKAHRKVVQEGIDTIKGMQRRRDRMVIFLAAWFLAFASLYFYRLKPFLAVVSVLFAMGQAALIWHLAGTRISRIREIKREVAGRVMQLEAELKRHLEHKARGFE